MRQPFRLLTSLTLLILSPFTQADLVNSSTANIEFTVNIVTWSCTISTSSQDITVNLGDYPDYYFKSAGQTTPAKYFSISLSDCNNTSVTTTFSGTADSANSHYLALNSNSTAKNIAVEILDNDKTALPLNTESAAVTVDSSGSATLGFWANYISTADSITGGSADADATFTINYY